MKQLARCSRCSAADETDEALFVRFRDAADQDAPAVLVFDLTTGNGALAQPFGSSQCPGTGGLTPRVVPVGLPRSATRASRSTSPTRGRSRSRACSPGRRRPTSSSTAAAGVRQITAWANDGEIGFSRFNWDSREWESKAYTEVDVEPGVPFDFQLVVGEKTLRLAIDGKEVLTWDHDGAEMHGSASVEAADRIVWVEGLAIVELGEKGR